jgi:hypothetical protein
MKLLIVSLMMFTSLLQATEYTKEDRIKDMNEMAQAMNVIQSGFFYNNYETVEAGVSKLKDAVVRVKPPLEEEQEQDLMNKYMNQKIQMSNKIVKKINQKALTILQRFKEGDSAQAVQAYTKIMGQCIQCHREMRNW